MHESVRKKLQHEIQQIDQLIESFRHFFRNSYAYQLDWNQMQPLVTSIHETWNGLKSSLFHLLEENEEIG